MPPSKNDVDAMQRDMSGTFCFLRWVLALHLSRRLPLKHQPLRVVGFWRTTVLNDFSLLSKEWHAALMEVLDSAVVLRAALYSGRRSAATTARQRAQKEICNIIVIVMVVAIMVMVVVIVDVAASRTDSRRITPPKSLSWPLALV